ncbi:MAG: M48 family metallopeptidase [Chitinispirillaceae bacterium]|nr:M48 family metallopeptidase [Chitinispirillaceae bacterium]
MGRSDTSRSSGPVEQLTLDLFPPRTFDRIRDELALKALTIHFNRRLKNSWYVKIHRGSDHRELHVPCLLENAAEPVKRALIEWATLPKPRRPEMNRALRQRRRELEERIKSFVDEQLPTPRPGKTPFQKWPTEGCRYDLKEVFATLNSRYFDNRLVSLLRWGTGATKTSYESTRKDASGNPYHRITIAGVYNHPEVPRFAMESIMYHEMLHIHIPPRKEYGRTVIHGPDFRRLERAFPHYSAWRKWEKEQLHPLRARMKRRGKGSFLQRVTGLVP